MEQYIKKSTLVAEIEKYISNYKGILNKIDKPSDEWVTSTLMLESKIDVLQHILSFLDTLEAKEVNLDKAARHYLLHEHISPLNKIFHQLDIKTEMQYHTDIENAFKTGFELGLNAQKGE